MERLRAFTLNLSVRCVTPSKDTLLLKNIEI